MILFFREKKTVHCFELIFIYLSLKMTNLMNHVGNYWKKEKKKHKQLK